MTSPALEVTQILTEARLIAALRAAYGFDVYLSDYETLVKEAQHPDLQLTGDERDAIARALEASTRRAAKAARELLDSYDELLCHARWEALDLFADIARHPHRSTLSIPARRQNQEFLAVRYATQVPPPANPEGDDTLVTNPPMPVTDVPTPERLARELGAGTFDTLHPPERGIER